MKDITAELHGPCLLQTGFYPDIRNDHYCCAGSCFSVLPEKGRGDFWVYSYDNLFSISIQDFVFYEDLFLEYRQPKYLSINYYESVDGEEIQPNKRQLCCNCVKGHIGHDNLYQAVYRKNIPIRSTGIVIMPEYYENYLSVKYPEEYEPPQFAFIGVDGMMDFPELVFLFRQIRMFRGTGMCAKLYYEGKVAEAISLILRKTSQERKLLTAECLFGQDLDRLASVVAYIDDHFPFVIHLDQLARISCMGTTKLKNSFKTVYKCTITEYIQNKRINHAELLLANTDLNINQIARTVGYTNPSRLSELFRKHTGLLPNEYRKLSLSK